MIHPDNSVWFHDHAPNEECTKNCYEHIDTAPIKHVPWRYFLRLDGALQEVHPLTIPHKYNGGLIKVKVVSTGEIFRIEDERLVVQR